MQFPVAEGRFIIDRMRVEDLDAVIKLGLSTPLINTGTDVPQFYTKETLLNWIKAERGFLLVVRVEGGVVGFSLASANPDSKVGYVNCLLTHSNSSNYSHSTKLLELTFTWLQQEMGCTSVFSLVHPEDGISLGVCQKAGMQLGNKFRFVQRSLP